MKHAYNELLMGNFDEAYEKIIQLEGQKMKNRLNSLESADYSLAQAYYFKLKHNLSNQKGLIEKI